MSQIKQVLAGDDMLVADTTRVATGFVQCLNFAVIPAVSELAPVAIDRGGYPSPLQSYPQFVAGIHPKGNQDGFPIKDVGHDAAGEKFPIYGRWMDSEKAR